MSDRILALLKQNANGLTLAQIKAVLPGATLSDMKELYPDKITFSGGLYKSK